MYWTKGEDWNDSLIISLHDPIAFELFNESIEKTAPTHVVQVCEIDPQNYSKIKELSVHVKVLPDCRQQD